MVLRDKTKLRPCGQFLKPNEKYGLEKKNNTYMMKITNILILN